MSARRWRSACWERGTCELVSLPALPLCFRELTERPDLKFKSFVARELRLPPTSNNIFAELRKRDILLHHPYDSFDAVVDFIESAASDPDVIQGRQYMSPEREPRRSPREQELYIPEEAREQARWALPPENKWPRVVVRYASERDLMLSGMMVGANEVAEKPAIVDVPHGNGHVVLFANNPMWRDETGGSYFFLLNAIMNWDHLDAGRAPARPQSPSDGADQ